MGTSYKLKNYEFVFIPKWTIKDYDHYYFTSDKMLFNSNTNRKSKQVVRNYSRGYNLDGKFITLKNMKPLISKVDYKTINYTKNIEVNDMFSFLLELY